MKAKFKNKVALITGGTSGIGKATAIAFAKSGATVVIVDKTKNPEALAAIKKITTKMLFIQCDVSNSTEVKIMIEKIITSFGRLDYAFNNAGIEGRVAITAECSEENWDNTLNSNLKGIWLCMKYEIPEMLKHHKGIIINCASVAGLVGFYGSPAYVASKHGVIGLTKTAALEYAREGIRINAVCPGIIATPMIDRVTKKDKETINQFTKMEPIGRLGSAEEVANAVIWLCSDEASFVTGHPMVVDGGFVAQ